MLQRYLLVWLMGFSLLAYVWPALPTPFDPFIVSRPALPYCIAAIMTVLGSLLPRDELVELRRRWRTVLFGTAVQFTAMPLLAFGFARWLLTDADAFVGLILVGAVPGAMASNVLTFLARGNVGYSISLTTAATLASPVVVPLALLLFAGTRVEVDPLEMFRGLTAMVVAPVLVGFGLAGASTFWRTWTSRLGPTVAHLAILWVIAAVVALNRDDLGRAGFAELAALVGVNLGGFAAGYIGGLAVGLPEGMRRALTLEIGMQNAGLGATLASRYFGERPAIAVLPALYTFGCMFTGTLLAQWWSRRPHEHGRAQPSIVAEGLDGIETRSTPGGVPAEEDADPDGHPQGQEDRGHMQLGG